MFITSAILSIVFLFLLPDGCATYTPSQTSHTPAAATRNNQTTATSFNGTYRLDARRSDKLYSVVSNAAANVPRGEQQQRIFDDLSVRLSSPDQLAIEQRGNIFFIASSRAERTRIAARRTDSTTDRRRQSTGATFNGGKLEVTSSGEIDNGDDQFYAAFELIDGADSLRVTRRIVTEGIAEPIIVRSVYERVSNVPRWNIYVAGEPSAPDDTRSIADDSDLRASNSGRVINAQASSLSTEARVLQARLDAWLGATNAKDIEAQMNFYSARLARYYLSSNVGRDAVRAEKHRVFARADSVDIRADSPEIIFTNAGQTAIMRFRKQYRITTRGRNRQGEVVQELRWQRESGAWKITSERDIRVIR